MPSAELTVTLPPDMAELIERKLRSGAYRSASEVIRDGLMTLEDREDDLEHWLGAMSFLAMPNMSRTLPWLPKQRRSLIA